MVIVTGADGDCTGRMIEVRKSDEQAVVGKTTRVREEVVFRDEGSTARR